VAEELRQVMIKIVVDGQEAIQEVQLTDRQFEKLKETLKITGETFKNINPVLDQFKTHLLGISAADEETIGSIVDFIKYNDLSQNQISQVIQKLQEEAKALALTSSEYKSHTVAIDALQGAYKNVIGKQDELPGSQNKIVQSANSMNMAIGQLGYALGDSSMFLMSFRSGLQSIANNIPMIIQYFQYAQKEAEKMSKTIGQSLVESLKGPGGLLLAVNGVMFLMQLLPKLFEDSTEEIKKTGNAAEEAAKKFMNLADKIAQFKFSSIEEARDTLKDYNKESDKAIENKKEELRLAKVEQENLKFKTVITKGEANTVSNTESREYKDAALNVKYLQSELNKLVEDKKLYNKSIEVSTDRLIKFKVALADGKISLSDLKKTIKDFTPNELSALQGSIDAVNGYLTVGSEKYDIAKGNAEKLKKAIEDLNKKYTPQSSSSDQLASEKKEAEELKGKLKELGVERNKSISQYEKDTQVLKINHDTKIKGIDAEIEALKKKDIIDASTRQKIDNLNTQKKVEDANYQNTVTKLTDEHYKNLLSKDYDFEQKKLELQKASDVQKLEKKREYFEKLYLLEPDPEKEKEIMHDLELIDIEITNKKIERAQEVRDIAVDAKRDELDRQEAEIRAWYAKQTETELYKNSLEAQLLIRLIFENKLDDLDKLRKKKEEERNQIIASGWANAFSSIYQFAEQSASYDIKSWKDKEEKKLEEEHKTLLKHAKTQKDRERIDQDYQNKKDKLDDEANSKAKEKLLVWFRLQQAANIASTIMSTYNAATAALKPAPDGLGPIWGIPLAAATVVAGLANVAIIADQKLPGYAKGGIVVGEKGPEVIAPMQDYASGQADLVIRTINAVQSSMQEISLGQGYGRDAELYGEMKKFNENIMLLAGRPVIAVIDKNKASDIANMAAGRRQKKHF
jgi:hypothetical protein